MTIVICKTKLYVIAVMYYLYLGYYGNFETYDQIVVIKILQSKINI